MKLNEEILELARQHNFNLKNYLSFPPIEKSNLFTDENYKINENDVIELFEDYNEFYESTHIYLENLMEIEERILNMNITLEKFSLYKQIATAIDKEEFEKIEDLILKLK